MVVITTHDDNYHDNDTKPPHSLNNNYTIYIRNPTSTKHKVLPDPYFHIFCIPMLTKSWSRKKNYHYYPSSMIFIEIYIYQMKAKMTTPLPPAHDLHLFH